MATKISAGARHTSRQPPPTSGPSPAKPIAIAFFLVTSCIALVSKQPNRHVSLFILGCCLLALHFTWLSCSSSITGRLFVHGLLFTACCVLSLMSCTDNCRNVSPVQLLASIV